ncbi:MAG: stage III sporulation protein AB [Clostridia bacterium]|nr:stage III sporulation protein AB [Clostridia bacterium]
MIFIKIIISIAILCITSYIGIEMAIALKSREQILTDMITFLKMVQNEMVYMLNNLPVSYEMSRQRLNSELKDVIGAIVVDMSKYGVDKIDMSITNNVNTLVSLKEYDKDIIISTLKNLGRSDLESQNNIIENAITIIEKQIKEANEVKVKSSKVYKTVGIISGLLIVVIFI